MVTLNKEIAMQTYRETVFRFRVFRQMALPGYDVVKSTVYGERS